MTIVTLTTDWNTNDYYVGAIKGKILSQSTQAQVVDISHQVQAYNINQAAFVLRNCFYNFPKGSVHIIGVNTESSKDIPFLLVEYKKHYFLGADNGIFGLLFSEGPEKIIELKPPADLRSFSSFSIFAEVASRLANGDKADAMGKVVKKYQEMTPLRAAIDKSVITGSVIYIDSFRNAITNITRDLFERIGEGRAFEIYPQNNYYIITRLNNFYHETAPGEILAIFNSVGLLEIAISKGNAADLLNLSTNSSVRIKFKEK